MKKKNKMIGLYSYLLEILGCCKSNGCNTAIFKTRTSYRTRKIHFKWRIKSEYHISKNSILIFNNILFFFFHVGGRESYLRFYFNLFIFISFSAWLAAAVDTNRVSAAIPVVMDLLNFYPVSIRDYYSIFL